MDLQHRHLHADRPVHAQRSLTAPSRRSVISAFTPAAPVLALVTLALSPAAASAQISVEVSPLRVELAAGPGSTTTQGITVTNAGKEPVRVRARLTDWDLSKDGAPQFESAVENGVFSATAWARVAPPEHVIEPGKEATVRYSMTVPAGAQPGGYRTGVLFEFGLATGDPVARAREVVFKSRIATLIYVNVGQTPVSADLTDLRSRPLGKQLQIVATVKNTSRRYVRTKGSLIAFDAAGAKIREVPVPDVPLLPESEREVPIVIVDPDKNLTLPPGDYRIELRLDVGLPALLVGETTLKVPR
jgi:P pilus assembly chaperone PapD